MAKKSGKNLERIRDPLLDEAAKTLFANIHFASVDEEIKTLVVTSTIPNEGKSTVALNLATTIAASGKNTLLVDTDMRRRNLAQLLKVHPPYGIYAAVSGEATLNKTIMRTAMPHLFFLDTEPNIPSPPDILNSRRFASMTASLRKTFDCIIFDTPPVTPFVDAAILSSLVDGTLLVLRQGFTKRADALKCLQQLRQANARILGCVMTFTKDNGHDYYYKYYTSTGGRHSPEKGSASRRREPSRGESSRGESSRGESRDDSPQQDFMTSEFTIDDTAQPAS